MEMEATRMRWVMWFNQMGAAEMERGCYLEAAMSFELGLSYLLFGQPLVLRSTMNIPEAAGSLPRTATTTATTAQRTCTGQSHDQLTCAHHFLFGSALELNALDDRHRELTETDVMTHKAAAMLNLSISLHRAGLEAGIQAWISNAKATYQATLQSLHAIDQVQAIRIGVYAFQNLAVLHYMQCEHDDCIKCLQSLYLTVQLGMDESILDDGVVSQVTMALFFYAQPPTAAGCA